MKLVWDTFYCGLNYNLCDRQPTHVRIDYNLTILDSTKPYIGGHVEESRHLITQKRSFVSVHTESGGRSYRSLILDHLQESPENSHFWVISEAYVTNSRNSSFVEIRWLSPRMVFDN